MMDEKERLIQYWTGENVLQEEKGYFDYATRKMFERYLSGLERKWVLDVGCGRGLSMEYFRTRGAITAGIDITPDSVNYVNTSGFNAITGDARNLPYDDNSFDVVYSIGVIEHFRETQLALNELTRVCKLGGTVIAVVPNLLTPYCVGTILFEFLSGRAIKYGIRPTYGMPFSRNEFTRMFVKAGCGEIRVHPYYGSAFLRFLFSTLHKRMADAVEASFLSRIGLVLWGIGRKM